MSTVGVTKRLGELLMGKGLLSAAQLDQALQEQRTSGELLGAILVRRKWVKEEDLLKALGEQMDIPYVRLASQAVDWMLANRFSPMLLTEHLCFPVRVEGLVLVVAIADPLDAWAMSALEKEAANRGWKLQLALAVGQEIRDALAKAKQHAIQSLRMPPS